MTRVFALLLASGWAWGADDARLRLALRAESDFTRVQLTATPQLRDAEACVQAQAALLAVAPTREAAELRFRKGFCLLTGALTTRGTQGFEAAAKEFDRSIAAWPDRRRDRNLPLEPVPPGLRVLAATARLIAGTTDPSPLDSELAAVSGGTCTPSLMPAALCQDLLGVARAWRGWLAMRQNRPDEAAAVFDPAVTPGWAAFALGRVALERRLSAQAVASLRRAVEVWHPLESDRPVSIPRGLAPPPELVQALEDLGGALLLAGDAKGAVGTLNEAVRRNSTGAWAIYLRARAQEAAGQPEAALSGYNLASRTGFAGDAGTAAGDGHFYRGVWLLRRHDARQAEEEFENALNSGVSAGLRHDVPAWRSLAAVASGCCGTSLRDLEKALPAASPFFPREEARAAATACSTAVNLSRE